MIMKLSIYDEDTVEPEVIYTLRLKESTNGYVDLNVVDPKTGQRLMDGTLMRFYPNGKVTYKPMCGCKAGGINGTIQKKV